MNRTKIDWADYTWNPVSGCLHNCHYCYAKKIANRFKGGGYGKEMGMFISKHKDDTFKSPYVLDEPQLAKTKDDWYRVAPYPFGFAPTFHKYRLAEPMQVKKPSKIFVCSMGDLFGDWVPDEWIELVFQACEDAPQHTYMFLTKNPKRYGFLHDIPKNAWLGATVTNFEQLNNTYTMANMRPYNKTFLSIEPLSEPINFVWDRQHIDGLTGCRLGPIQKHNHLKFFDWIIIGQQTGPGAVPPKDEWVQSIIDQCRTAGVPVFVKSPLYEKFPIQEWPEGLK